MYGTVHGQYITVIVQGLKEIYIGSIIPSDYYTKIMHLDHR
jgi:hypothetical protein